MVKTTEIGVIFAQDPTSLDAGVRFKFSNLCKIGSFAVIGADNFGHTLRATPSASRDAMTAKLKNASIRERKQ
jgi:hypothetical protein